MRDNKLELLIVIAALLFVAHTVDHVARDLRWPLTADAIPFLLITLAILAIVFGGLYLYRRGTVGPRFWTLLAAFGVGLGFIGHLSPWAAQPPQYILNAYRSPLAGWLAVGSLTALMLTLLALTAYAGMLWARSTR